MENTLDFYCCCCYYYYMNSWDPVVNGRSDSVKVTHYFCHTCSTASFQYHQDS